MGRFDHVINLAEKHGLKLDETRCDYIARSAELTDPDKADEFIVATAILYGTDVGYEVGADMRRFRSWVNDGLQMLAGFSPGQRGAIQDQVSDYRPIPPAGNHAARRLVEYVPENLWESTPDSVVGDVNFLEQLMRGWQGGLSGPAPPKPNPKDARNARLHLLGCLFDRYYDNRDHRTVDLAEYLRLVLSADLKAANLSRDSIINNLLDLTHEVEGDEATTREIDDAIRRAQELLGARQASSS